MDGQLADRQKETAPGRETDVGRDPKASPAVTVSHTKSSVHPPRPDTVPAPRRERRCLPAGMYVLFVN